MTAQMDEKYFAEKKNYSSESISRAISEVNDALVLIKASSYDAPNVTTATEVHQKLQLAVNEIQSARRDYEKSRWAAAKTELQFNEWLTSGLGNDLV
jgi:hypothetical protein